MLRRLVPTLRQSANNNVAIRGFSSSGNNVDLPRITERRTTGKSEFVLFYDMNSCVQYKRLDCFV